MHLLIFSLLARPSSAKQPRAGRAGRLMRACAFWPSLGVAAAVGCTNAEPANNKSATSECFSVTPAGPMRRRDSVKLSKVFRIVRLDSTHIRWNADVDSTTRKLRYLYLDPKIESLGYGVNFWAQDSHSDTVHIWGGNGFAGVHLALARRGASLLGPATVGGDAPGVGPRFLGLVRADPVACGSLVLRRPADAGWSTDDAADTGPHGR